MALIVLFSTLDAHFYYSFRMFSNDQNISSLKDLILEIKAYISMRYELAKLDFVSKFTVLFAMLLLYLVLLVLLGMALLFLSYGAAKGIAGCIGSESVAFLIIAALYLLVALLAYLLRVRIFIRPMAKFLSRIFLDPKEKKEDQA